MTLSMLAHAFLSWIRMLAAEQEQGSRSARGKKTSHSPEQFVPLTVPEVRRLLALSFSSPDERLLAHGLHWSH